MSAAHASCRSARPADPVAGTYADLGILHGLPAQESRRHEDVPTQGLPLRSQIARATIVAARMEACRLIPVARSTERAYLEAVKRLLNGRAQPKTQAAARYLRSAWIWFHRTCIHRLLSGGVAPASGDNVPARIHELEAHLRALSAIATDSVRQPRGRSSKRQGIGALPPDWRERLLDAAPTDELRQSLALMSLTGLRPAELACGVKVDVTPSRLQITIQGSKVTSMSGQPWRRITVMRDHPWALMLTRTESPETVGFTLTAIPSRLRHAVRTLGEQVFPHAQYRITPYTFRHQWSADQKRLGCAPQSIAMGLGHRSTRTQQGYGYCGQGTPKSPLGSIEIAAGSPVRTPSRPFQEGSRHIVKSDGMTT